MKNAIVVGGGVAGLASAKVLSQHFDKVTVFDGGPQPQALHLHVLLRKGQELLEDLFPGILKKMQSVGCPEIDWAQDTVWENNSGAFPRYQSVIKSLSMSRVLLQKLMKEDLVDLPNVVFVNQRVESLEEIDAELIVVAGGQNFSLNGLITSEKILPINLTYRSYVFNQSELKLGDSKQYYYQVDPPHSLMGGVICPIEDGKMMVTLIESEKNFTPCRSFDHFMEMASRIPGNKFHAIIGHAKPLSELSVFRKTSTHRRHLDLAKVPKNTILLGDVLTSLNPVFGQGMTVSLMQAHLLGRMLTSKLDVVKFHRSIQRLSFMPYSLSKLGSQEMGIGKTTLRGYLRACQKVPFLHHNFLKRLHYP